MKIDEFVKEYVKADEDGKEKMIAEHVTTPYIPYLRKVAIAQGIVDQTQYIKDEDGHITGFRLNTPIRYLVTLMQMVAEYTDLEESKNTYEDFDTLQQAGVLSAILDYVKNDFTIFENVVQMTSDDTYADETNLVRHLTFVESELLDGLQDAINRINEALKTEENKDGVSDS